MILTFVIGLIFLGVPFFLSGIKSKLSVVSLWQTELTRFNKFSIFFFILISSITAIYHSGFQTIQLISLPLIAVLAWKINFGQSKFKITLIELIIVFSSSFLLVFLAFGLPLSAKEINIYYDFHFYAELSQKIIEARKEHFSALFSSYTPQQAISLYHYTDLWFTGFFSNFLQQPTILILCFFTYPILITIGFFTLKEFIQELGYENSLLKTSLVILLITYGFSFPTNIFQNTFFEISYSHFVFIPGFDIYSTKTLILLPIITMAFSCLMRKDYLSFTAFILLAIVTYSTTLLFFSVLLFVVLMHKLMLEIKTGNWNNRENYWILFVVLVYFFSFAWVIFFWVDFTVLPKNASVLSIKSIFILFFEYNFSYILVYILPLIFILFIESKENKWIAIKIALFIFISSSLTSIYLIKYTDESNSIQALLNAIPFIFLILSLLIYTFLSRGYRQILVIFFLLCASYNIVTHTVYNGQFNEGEKTIQALLENENSPKKWAVIDTSLTDNKYYKYNQIGMFLFYNKNLDYPIDFSNYFILSNEQLVKLTLMNIGLIEQEWLNNPSIPKDDLFYDFINKNGVSFILSRNSKANELLAKRTLKENKFSLKYRNNELMLWEVVRNGKK